MADQWMNIKDGQVRGYNPGFSVNDPMNWIKLPDQNAASAMPYSRQDFGPPREATQFEKDMSLTFRFLLKWGIRALLAYCAWVFVTDSIDAHFKPKPQMVSSSAVYAADSIENYDRLPWNEGKLFVIHGGNVVITGTIRNVNIQADGNLTAQGDVVGSGLRSLHGSIHAVNVKDSVLTASRIVVTGQAVNTRKNFWLSH